MFAAARDAFAGIYRLREAAVIQPPPTLAGAEFGLTLAVHMAALVAVDIRAAGTDARPGPRAESVPPAEVPTDRSGLTMYLLDSERLHWARLYGDGANAGRGGNGFRTPPEVMNRTVYTAVLTGTLSRTAGTTVLRRLQVPDAPEALDDHASCYPPAEPGADQVLEPLYPDRLAEDFLALTLPGHRFAYPGRPWAEAAVSKPWRRTSRTGSTPTWTPGSRR
jgi:hypothetical protein